MNAAIDPQLLGRNNVRVDTFPPSRYLSVPKIIGRLLATAPVVL